MELNKNFSTRWFPALLIVFLAVIGSCKKEDPLRVGAGLLPGNELIDVGYDSLPVEVYTVDNIPVSTRSIDLSPLGSINDPDFGTLKAEFLADFLPDGEVFFRDDISDSIYADSLILWLAYQSLDGDSSLVSFDIHELRDSIIDTLKSDFDVPLSMYDPSSLVENIQEHYYDTASKYNFIKVKLKQEFADKFLNPDMVDDSAYYYIPYFKKYFRGLYFTTDYYQGNYGGMLNINRSNSAMRLYTTQIVKGGTSVDSVEISFIHSVYPSLSLHLNLYNEERSNAVASVANDTTHPQQLVYMRSMAGTRVLVKIPGLSEKRKAYNYSRIINRAEIVFPVDRPSIFDEYPHPDKLGMRTQNGNSILLDDNPSANSTNTSFFLNYFRGYYYSAQYQYSFDIGNHIHAFFQADTSGTAGGDSFYIFPSEITSPCIYERYRHRRLILNGSLAERKPYIKIIYSEIPK